MKIKDPEVLETLRAFCKLEVRRMNAEERAEMARRKTAKASRKHSQKTKEHLTERKPSRKVNK